MVTAKVEAVPVALVQHEGDASSARMPKLREVHAESWAPCGVQLKSWAWGTVEVDKARDEVAMKGQAVRLLGWQSDHQRCSVGGLTAKGHSRTASSSAARWRWRHGRTAQGGGRTASGGRAWWRWRHGRTALGGS
jgi:hypothetical protein